MRWVSRLTTISVVLVIVGAIALAIHSAIPETTHGGGFHTYAKFRDGSRLAVGSPVVIAGVRIGDVSQIAISGRFARIDMQLQDDVEIPVDSFVTRRADSLFGDSYLEIILAAPTNGPQPMLASGQPIVHVIEGASTDAMLRTIDRSIPKIESALSLVHEVMTNGRKFVNGPAQDRFESTERWLAGGNVERPLESARLAMVRLDELTAAGAASLHAAAPDVDGVLDRTERAVVDARTRIRDVKASLVSGMAGVREGMNDVDEPLRKAGEVMAAIDRGEGEDFSGTLGRLVNDPQLGEDLEDASAAGREAVGGFNRFRSWLGARIELNVFSRVTRFYASAELRGRTDKFYLVEFERGPLGGAPSDALSDASGSSSWIRTQEIRDELRFTAMFGKQLGPLSLRIGLKDSTFGVGSDLTFLDGRLKFSADVMGSFQRSPRLKLSGAVAVFRSIYVLAGIDDALHDPGYLPIRSGRSEVPDWFDKVRYGRDYFVGGVLHFSDADLATLLRVYGAVLASAIAF